LVHALEASLFRRRPDAIKLLHDDVGIISISSSKVEELRAVRAAYGRSWGMQLNQHGCSSYMAGTGVIVFIPVNAATRELTKALKEGVEQRGLAKPIRPGQ